MENLINEMAENLKGFQADTNASIEEVKATVSVVKDELQKQIDSQLAAQKKAAKKEVKYIDEVIMENQQFNAEEMAAKKEELIASYKEQSDLIEVQL